MFEIIVDSAANIPAELCKKYKIKVLSFVNLVNGKEMTCFEPDLTPEQERAKGKEYYDAIREGAEVKTGLISSGIFEDTFREIIEADKDILYFSLSKNKAATTTQPVSQPMLSLMIAITAEKYAWWIH